MKKMFSPWRSAYIGSFQDTKKKKGCLFCRIAKEQDDKKNLIVWRGKECFVVMNRYPYNSGHVMIVPYIHTSSMKKIPDTAFAEVMRTAARCTEHMKKSGNPDGFNFGANLGRTAGAGIDTHIHFHLVPRWNGDTNFMPLLADVKVVSEDMQKSWSALKRLFEHKK